MAFCCRSLHSGFDNQQRRCIWTGVERKEFGARYSKLRLSKLTRGAFKTACSFDTLNPIPTLRIIKITCSRGRNYEYMRLQMWLVLPVSASVLKGFKKCPKLPTCVMTWLLQIAVRLKHGEWRRSASDARLWDGTYRCYVTFRRKKKITK